MQDLEFTPVNSPSAIDK